MSFPVKILVNKYAKIFHIIFTFWKIFKLHYLHRIWCKSNFWPGGGGRQWTICPKNSRKMLKCLRNCQRKARVIRCTNKGLHMKWKYSYIRMNLSYELIKHIKRNICLCHFDSGRYQWYVPCHWWLQSSVLISAMLLTRCCPVVLRR